MKEVRAVIADAKRELTYAGRRTVLFIDEVHRFSKTQQDSPAVRGRGPDRQPDRRHHREPVLLRGQPAAVPQPVLALQPLGDDDVRALLRRALTSDRGLDGAVTLSAEAEEHLRPGRRWRRAQGPHRAGVRRRCRAGGGRDGDRPATLETAVAQAAVRYDRQGDQHYDVASALIKSIRGSDVDAALHYLARMVEAGEDPRFIARRLVISASEDIGMADPTALLTAVAAADAVAFIGMPEGHFPLAHAVVHLATAPKSNAVTVAMGESVADVRAGLAGPVPPGLRDAHYAGAKKLGHGKTYVYPHDHPDGVVAAAVPARRPGRPRLLPADQPRRRGRDLDPAGQARGRSSAAAAEPVGGEADDRRPPRLVCPTGRARPRQPDQPSRRHESENRGSARVSAGEIAGLIAALAVVVLVLLLAVPLLKLGRTLDETTLTIRQVREQSAPILSQASRRSPTSNSNLERVDDITGNAANVSSNVAALTSVVAATLGSPLIKVAAFSYGVRSATQKKREGQALADARGGTRTSGARAAPRGGPPDAPAVLAGHGHHDRRPRRPQAVPGRGEADPAAASPARSPTACATWPRPSATSVPTSGPPRPSARPSCGPAPGWTRRCPTADQVGCPRRGAHAAGH